MKGLNSKDWTTFYILTEKANYFQTLYMERKILEKIKEFETSGEGTAIIGESLHKTSFSPSPEEYFKRMGRGYNSKQGDLNG